MMQKINYAGLTTQYSMLNFTFNICRYIEQFKKNNCKKLVQFVKKIYDYNVKTMLIYYQNFCENLTLQILLIFRSE